jgi:hypothetical protein
MGQEQYFVEKKTVFRGQCMQKSKGRRDFVGSILKKVVWITQMYSFMKIESARMSG